VKHEFNRTPSFAWLPVRGAIRYEFELATSKTFSESSIVWSKRERRIRRADDHDARSRPRDTDADVETSAAKLAKLYKNLRTRPSPSIWRCPGSPARRTPSTRTFAR
jgi:hypothetical protein